MLDPGLIGADSDLLQVLVITNTCWPKKLQTTQSTVS
jgi:hypothetical protein